jgi:clan AA aspartic protease (TIGR02281 family)
MRLAFIAIAFAFAADAAGEAPQCKFVRIAEWSLRANYYRPVMDGEINGQKVGVLLDSGATSSKIWRSATARLGLPRQQLEGHQVFGIGGETHAEVVVINEFRIGKAVRKNWRVMVAGEHDVSDDQAVIIGDDFLGGADIEYDLRNNTVRVFQAKDCAGLPLAYWSREALEIRLQGDEKIEFTVALNGKPLRAMLDSGATYSLLEKAEAERRGVTPSSPGAKAAGCVRGFGARTVDSWTGQFESFAIGEELIRNPRIQFADMWRDMTYTETGTRLRRQFAGNPQILLGADFLRSHRVLVARSQKKMYFTYEGGTVFPDVAGRPCNAAPDKAKPG